MPHSHFHIIPRLGAARDVSEITDAERKNIVLGEGPREKLGADDGARISEAIKAALKDEIEKLKSSGEIGLTGDEEDLFVKISGNGLKL